MPQHRPSPLRPRRQTLATAIGLALCTLSHPVWAIGFGMGQIVSLLGQPLDFSVQIAGEADAAALNCLTAEVLAGESRVDPHSVSSHLEPASTRAGAWMHVQTTVPIDEPVVTVVVGAGCTARLSRRFVVFVDPPREHVAAALPAVEAVQGTGLDPAWALSPTPLPAAGGAPMAVPPSDATAVAADDAPTRRHAPSERHASRSASTTRAAREPSRRVAARKVPSAVAATTPQDDRSPAPATDGRAPVGARLKLDDEPDFTTLAAAREPSGVASAPSATPPPTVDAARYSALEARLAKLDADSAAASANVDRLRQQLHAVTTAAATAEPTGQHSWFWEGVSAVLGLAVALLAWQRMRPPPASDWRDSTSPSVDAQVALATVRTTAASPSEAMRLETAAASSTTVDLVLPGLATAPPGLPAVPVRVTETASGDAAVDAAPPSNWTGASVLAGGPTVEELLDVEQQFDFFTALGQDAAAIEMMRSLMGGNHADHPMPYLKLMEVHRRLGEEGDFRHVHAAFSSRFNAMAPDWEAGPSSVGRSIEDYPEQLAALIEAWPTPADAASRLGDWIARSPAAANDERLDMPAFRDLVFLQTLAREMTVRDSRQAALQPLSFDALPLLVAGPVAAMAPPQWNRGKDVPAGSGPDVDIELDLQLANHDDEDDGRFDLPFSSSQAAAHR